MNELKESIAAYLRGWTGLAECDILCEYPARRALPLRRAALAVGLDGIDLSPAGLGNYFGAAATGDGDGSLSALYGSTAVVTLRCDVYLPGSDGAGCHRLYEELCAALTGQSARFGLLRLWCDPIKYDADAGASRLTARAALRAAFTGSERAAAIREFRVRAADS